MPRFAIKVAYKGTGYSGWQIQPGDRTIQGELYHALKTILRQEIRLVGSGRTDSGVHAGGQIAHFDFEGEIDPAPFLRSMYGLLPRDIAVTGIHIVPGSFHARFSAVSRTYRYRVIRKPDPLMQEFSWFVPHATDPDMVQECWKLLPGEHDFSNFTRRNPLIPHYRCTILHAAVEVYKNGFGLSITANRFLRSMVRLLAGAAVKAGRGRITTDWFKQALYEPEIGKPGYAAPPSGLVLERVDYGEEYEKYLL